MEVGYKYLKNGWKTARLLYSGADIPPLRLEIASARAHFQSADGFIVRISSEADASRTSDYE